MEDLSMEKLLLELAAAPGVAGSEEAAVTAASRYLSFYTDEVKGDRFGNLIASKKGERRKGEKAISLALMAHIDEIGLMAAKIEPEGFLRFTVVGGIDPRTLMGQTVMVHGKKPLPGVIGALAPHLLTASENQKVLKTEELFIDTGFSREQVEQQVKVGDFISLDQQPLVLEGGACLTGKALDNRAGVACMILCARELYNYRHQADIYYVATRQEEVGLRGAITASYGLYPDLALVVDVTHGQAPGLSGPKVHKLGQGTTVAMGPNIHPSICKRLQELARDYHIPFQLEPLPGHSGTDAWAVQVSREGIPTGLVSIPLRYMHSAVELVHLDDLKNTALLLACFGRSLERSFMEELRCF